MVYSLLGLPVWMYTSCLWLLTETVDYTSRASFYLHLPLGFSSHENRAVVLCGHPDSASSYPNMNQPTTWIVTYNPREPWKCFGSYITAPVEE